MGDDVRDAIADYIDAIQVYRDSATAEDHAFHLAYVMGHDVIDLDTQRELAVVRQEAYARLHRLFAALSEEDQAAARARIATIHTSEMEAAIDRLINLARQSREAGQ